MAQGPEARADVHRADFSNRDETDGRGTKRKHTEATLDGRTREGREEDNHR